MVLSAAALCSAHAGRKDIDGPDGSRSFGKTVTVLPNGNFVVTDPDFNGSGWVRPIGAVYLYDGITLELISRLTGSTEGDYVGSDGITVVSHSNFVVRSPHWRHGEIWEAGAATWCSGTKGLNGVVSAENSLVGGTHYDNIGTLGTNYSPGGITVLSSGNYLLSSPEWRRGAGALTWCRADGSVTGVISPANSLTGGTDWDRSGWSNSITLLPDGNFLASSPYWDNGSAEDAGALTWGSGVSPTVGVISAANSLVGGTSKDHVGGPIMILSNGNYLVGSSQWDNGSMVDAGALTWGSAAGGVRGLVSAENSVVGSSANASVGLWGVSLLTNGNYVVSHSYWGEGTALTGRGAVRWCSGTSEATGPFTVENSLIGGHAQDQVGTVHPLDDGDYIVVSPGWDHGAAEDAGAVTLCDGTVGTKGLITSENSLTGFKSWDAVGAGGIKPLGNGNLVVCSPEWGSGRGAVTFVKRGTPVRGIVSSLNSLTGGRDWDMVGSGGVFPLGNGHYVVSSPWWTNGAGPVYEAGAVTWGSGTEGVSGEVSEANSLVGGSHGDRVGMSDGGWAGGLTVLANGHYVVSSPMWDHGAMEDAGAVTWGSGTEGVRGMVSAANSLVGGAKGDYLGIKRMERDRGYQDVGDGVTALSNGNYVVSSPMWHNGVLAEAGAVTLGSGAEGVRGVLSEANSLVGGAAGDLVGTTGAVQPMVKGNYLVLSRWWDHGNVRDAGAVTFGSGMKGVTGTVSPANSLTGGAAEDGVGSPGSVVLLPGAGGGYLVRNPQWRGNTGAVTYGSGDEGVTGGISGVNSLIGGQPGDVVGSHGIEFLSGGGWLVKSGLWNQSRGAVTWCGGAEGLTGEVSAENSLVGGTARDRVGSDAAGPVPAIRLLANGNYLVVSPDWFNGSGKGSGAVTWAHGGTGVRGVVSAENSLISGGVEGRLGGGLFTLSLLEDGNFVVPSGNGAWFLGNGGQGVRGPLTPAIIDLEPWQGPSSYGYNPKTTTLIAGYPWHNKVILLSLEDTGGPETPLQKWRSLHFGGAAAGTGNLEDFDADGVSNLLEFTFGTHPTDSASGPAALQFSGTVAGGGALTAAGSPVLMSENGALSVLFVRRQDHAVAGLGYTVQFSTDLRTWTASAENPRILADDGTSQLVTVPCPWESGAAAGFFRLRVTVAP